MVSSAQGGVDSTNEIQCHSPQLGRLRVNPPFVLLVPSHLLPPVKEPYTLLIPSQLSSSDVSPDPSRKPLTSPAVPLFDPPHTLAGVFPSSHFSAGVVFGFSSASREPSFVFEV